MAGIRRTLAVVLGGVATVGLALFTMEWSASNQDCSDPITSCPNVFAWHGVTLLLAGGVLGLAAILWIGRPDRGQVQSVVLSVAGLLTWLTPLTVFRSCQTEFQSSAGVLVTDCSTKAWPSVLAVIGGFVLFQIAIRRRTGLRHHEDIRANL